MINVQTIQEPVDGSFHAKMLTLVSSTQVDAAEANDDTEAPGKTSGYAVPRGDLSKIDEIMEAAAKQEGIPEALTRRRSRPVK